MFLLPMASEHFSTASGKRLLKSESDKRTSEGSADRLLELLEDVAREVSIRANEMADHSDRKTIHSDDVKMASREIRDKLDL